MSDFLHDLGSCLRYRIAYGEAARLAEIAQFDHASGRDAAARIGGERAAIAAEVARRMGLDGDGHAPDSLIELAVDDALDGLRPRW